MSEALYLNHEELLLVGKLFIYSKVLNEMNQFMDRSNSTIFVVVEILEENQEFLFVPTKDSLYLLWFLRVRDEHLRGPS